jgi:hypothetical protein
MHGIMAAMKSCTLGVTRLRDGSENPFCFLLRGAFVYGKKNKKIVAYSPTLLNSIAKAYFWVAAIWKGKPLFLV